MALIDLTRLVLLAAHSRRALAAENLFLRKQLALFQERKVRARRPDDATRWMMATLSRMFHWRDALVNVKPDTLIRWHREGFRLFWRLKSRPVGRPRLPKDLQGLIRRMATENPTWVQQRIANELPLKLGMRVSPRTIQKYLSGEGPGRKPDPKQRWLTFVRNHAKVMVACDFFVVGTARRECLDFLIPLNERHLKLILKSWVTHFNRRRPHMSLGPGIPAPLQQPLPKNPTPYSSPVGYVIRTKAILGGLHHEYSLEKAAA